jgi:hypothetical protein
MKEQYLEMDEERSIGSEQAHSLEKKRNKTL